MSGNRKESTNTRPVVHEPPYLAVGTEVSAKFRGAFCEANIKSVKKLVKCKVNFENGGGSSTVTDDCVIGELKVGSDVKVKVPDGVDIAGILVRIMDSSSYTVVFDDGDERTLKRSSLCIKGEKHFNESETLDHLPLTDPENFGTPVMQQGKKSRKGRCSLSVDEGKEEEDMHARKKLNLTNNEAVDKVVMIDVVDKKKSFQLPVLLLSSAAAHYDVKSPENVLVRSFKDGRLIEVHPKDVKKFSKEIVANPSMKSAVQHAVKYLETKKLPSNWSDDVKNEILKNEASDHSSSSEAESEDDENKKTEFLKKLTKFLNDKGTPLVRSPVLGHQDLDLYKLFKIVSKMKGMNKVESWFTVYKKMNIPVITTTASYHIKNAYKRYLYDYEIHTHQEDSVSSKAKHLDKSSNESVSNDTWSSSKNDEETLGSDSEKDSKDLCTFSDIKLRKLASKRGRRNMLERGKSLKCSNSLGLSPPSPYSPKSISSVSASESAGCPSPGDNYCDVRELRGRVDSVIGKCDEKDQNLSFGSMKNDVIDQNRENGSKDISNCKPRKLKKGKACKEDEIPMKVMNSTVNVENDIEVKHDVTKEEECACKEDKLQNNKILRRLNEDNPLDEGDGSGDDLGKTVHDIDTFMDIQGQEGTDVEDAVDVVNSPSGTSETLDSDDRCERKTEKKSKKKESEGKQLSTNDVSDGSDDLKYNINDRIDVRYGRGRNATIYHAKITYVDRYAEEGLYYLVHYQGWNARHDEWIGNERIIGRAVKQTRTRIIKEPSKNMKSQPKPTPKTTPKCMGKKNGKNGCGHIGRTSCNKSRKRTPSPPMNMAIRNSNNRSSKSRVKENTILKTELSAEVKYPARTTRRNSFTSVTETSEQNFLEQKISDVNIENDKESVSSPSRARVSTPSLSPKRRIDNTSEPTVVIEEMLDDEKKVEIGNVAKCEVSVDNTPSGLDVGEGKTMKRTREDEGETSSSDCTPSKKKLVDKDSSVEVFEGNKTGSRSKNTNSPGVEATVDEASGPDLTCSEELPMNCSSPDTYAGDFPPGESFYRNSKMSSDAANTGSREKDTSSSIDDGKVEKLTPGRRTNGRRDRKTRAPSSQSSVETSESQLATSNGPTVTVMLSPSWTPKYNFTEDLDELLKNQESSERIRLLTEKIKDIRKVYGELKSEVANIDRKRKRRQKRKREEELSTEESATRSPSRSSPLTTSNAVSSSNTLAAVECR